MSNTHIVVGAYDKYSVIWKPLKHGFDKYIPNNPFQVDFITNFAEAPVGFNSIKVGEDKSWGSSIKQGIEQVKAKYILWMMDDFWITGPVQVETLRRYIDILILNELDHIRLLPPAYPIKGVVPERECKHVSTYDDRLWVFKDDAEYRASATIGLWKKEVFLNYIKDGMTPWQFEQEAGKASRGNDRYLCNIDPYVFPVGWYCNPYPNGKNSVLSRGKWDESAVEYATYEGLEIDFSVHPSGEPNEQRNV